MLNFLLILRHSYQLGNSSNLLSDIQISQKKCFIYVWGTAGWVISAKTSKIMLRTWKVHNFGLFLGQLPPICIAFRLQQKFKTVIKNFNLSGREALKTLRDKRLSHLKFEKICRYQNPASRTFLVMLNACNFDLPDLHDLYDLQMIDLDVS